MKILFVTGDNDCECKGTGKVDKTGKYHLSEQFNVCLCECVVAKEATVETWIDPKQEWTETKGIVVPK